ncbi:MAG: PAS domain-containing protein, partial [Calditrichaeota bacterium]
MPMNKIGLKKKFLISSFTTLVFFSVLGSLLLYFSIHEQILSLGTAAIFLTLFYILVGISGILIISHIMVQPIIVLTRKIHEVQQGNLDIQLTSPKSRDPADEMDALFLGFNQMVRKLRQNIRDLQKAKENAETLLQKLSRTNKKLEAIFSGIPDGIMIIDREYRIVDANPVIKQLIGKDFAKIRGEHCFELCQGTMERCSFCRADVVFQMGGNSYTQCSKRTSLGREERIFEIYDFPLVNEKGEVEQVIEYVKDVTEAVKMQKHLEQAKNLAEIGKMSSIVAHEVRNPLNAITGAVRYLKGEISEANLQSYLSLIEEQVQRVSGVTDEMLDFARPLFLEFSYSQIQPHIDKALDILKDALQQKKIRVIKNYDKTLPLLPLDGAQVERALVNLFKNAIDAMDDGGELKISCEYHKDVPSSTLREVEIVIEDNGRGLGDKDPEELFKPFVTTKIRGTGLGLPVV